MAAQQYTDEELLDHLRELSNGETGPTVTEVGESNGPSYNTYYHRFGSYTEAVRAANLEPVGIGGNSPGPDPKYSREELLSWIEAFVAEFGVVPSPDDVKSWPGPSAHTYRKRFGGWREAVRAAGYEPRNETGGGSE